MEQSPEIRPPGRDTERVTQTPMGVERHERTVVDGTGGEHAETSTRDRGAEQNLQLYKAVQLIWLLLGIVEVLIGLRVVLKLFAANANNGFASFIYSVAGVFVAPFVGLTGTPAAGIGAGGFLAHRDGHLCPRGLGNRLGRPSALAAEWLR